MKINKLFAVALCAASLVSCSDVLDTSENEEMAGNVPVDGTPVPTVFTATQEGTEVGSRARIDINNPYQVVWTSKDSISIFDTQLSNRRFELTSGEKTTQAQFKGEAVATSKPYAIYPYQPGMKYTNKEGVVSGVELRDVQYNDFDSYGTSVNGGSANLLMMGVADAEKNFNFINCCAIIKLNLSFANVKVDSIVVSSNAGEPIAGVVTMNYNNGDPKVESVQKGKSSIVFKASSGSAIFTDATDGSVTHTRYIAVLPGTLENGFTIAARSNSSKKVYYFGTTKTVTLERNKVYKFDFDYKLSEIPTVDMGDGVHLATMNIGAMSPTDIGDRFAWGETTTKDDFTRDNYKFTVTKGAAEDSSEDTFSAYTRYNQPSGFTNSDERTILQLSDDAAYVNSNHKLCMMSLVEQKKIKANCTIVATKINGVNVHKITSNITGNSIIIPYVQYYYDGGLHGYSIGTWMSNLSGRNSYSAHAFWGNTAGEQMTITGVRRYAGNPVRGIKYIDNSTEDYVDMKLPSGLMWARCNIGARLPQMDGDYYTYGETKTKSEYTTANMTYNSYAANSVLSSANDVATQVMGAGWSVPTIAQWNELINNSTITFISSTSSTYDYTAGLELTSTVNGNKLFFPMSGWMDGTSKHVWSSGHYNSDYMSKNAFSSGMMPQVAIVYAGSTGGDPKIITTNPINNIQHGLPVRPVYKK